jgi:hypothetical protein
MVFQRNNMTTIIIIDYFAIDGKKQQHEHIELVDYQSKSDEWLMFVASATDDYIMAKSLIYGGSGDYSFAAAKACTIGDYSFLTYIAHRKPYMSIDVKNDVLSTACNIGDKKTQSYMISIGANECTNCDNSTHPTLDQCELP